MHRPKRQDQASPASANETNSPVDHGQVVAYKEHHDFLFDKNPFPAWIFEFDTLRILKVNQAAIEFYGYTEAQFLSITLPELRPVEEIEVMQFYLDKIRKNESFPVITWKHLRRDGEPVFVEVRGTNIKFLGKDCRLVMINDVTARINTELSLKLTNEQYRQANERFNIIAQATHDLVWDWDLDKNDIHRDQQGLEEVYGITDPESIRSVNHWLEHIHPEDLENVKKTIAAIVQAGGQKIFEIEYRFRKEDGEYNHVYDRGHILRNELGKICRVIGAAQNITERKRLEQEILNKQKEISRAAIISQERERSEISKELHDNVNQLLTTTKLYLDLALANPELKDEMITRCSGNIANAIREIRNLSQWLMTPSLGDLGLADSIDDLVENLNLGKKINAIFIHEPINEERLDENQKLALFRITQEAFNNIVKHSEATSTTIELCLEEKIIRLSISDDGRGFDPGTTPKGAGLNNIRNRVYLLDGKFVINTQPGKGCALVVELPHHR